jgi:xanthine dehydrogenase small subunit
MTIWFLALDAEIQLAVPPSVSDKAFSAVQTLPLKSFFLGYKQLAKFDEQIIISIRFRKPTADFRFNFEKVCKRTYLDIATVNTAISLSVDTTPGKDWVPPALSKPGAAVTGSTVEHFITNAHVSAGGVAPIPLYLKETSSFLVGRKIDAETVEKANEIIQAEISPISDVRGSAKYKRLLMRQLFKAHFYEIFGTDAI